MKFGFFCFFIFSGGANRSHPPPRSNVFFGAHSVKISTDNHRRTLFPFFPSSLPVSVARPLSTPAPHHWQIALSSAVILRSSYRVHTLPCFDGPVSPLSQSRLSLATCQFSTLPAQRLSSAPFFSNQHTAAALIILKACFLSGYLSFLADRIGQAFVIGFS